MQTWELIVLHPIPFLSWKCLLNPRFAWMNSLCGCEWPWICDPLSLVQEHWDFWKEVTALVYTLLESKPRSFVCHRWAYHCLPLPWLQTQARSAISKLWGMQGVATAAALRHGLCEADLDSFSALVLASHNSYLGSFKYCSAHLWKQSFMN